MCESCEACYQRHVCFWLLSQGEENNAGESLSQSASRSGSIPSVNQLPQFIDSLDVNTDAPAKDEGNL